MKHQKSRAFRDCYDALPDAVRKAADKAFEQLKSDPKHPSLHFKKVTQYWSARVDRRHRALAVKTDKGLVWFWIGKHDEYDRMIRS